MTGKVYLVGAGPGDPKLLTLKGQEVLSRAEVVVYDRLASPNLLRAVPAGAERIYVGKAADRHTLRQEQINELLYQKAAEGKRVVRLKGGDSFVFGRGGEEAEYLVERGIPFEVVPGVTSAVSVPAYAGIPVTHRGVASSFMVVTGHEDPGKTESTIPWEAIGKAETVVVLMGVENLPYLTSQMIAYGRDPETPAALVRWGTRPEQETLVGTLSNLVQKVREVNFKPPALLVVGPVVKLREILAWSEKRPLFGLRVLVTRSRSQASVLSQALEDLGAEAWELPVLAFKEPSDPARLDRAVDELRSYQWLIFTSQNGVESFLRRLAERKKDIRELHGIKLVAIGPKTAEALEKRGLLPLLVPGEYRAEALVESLKDMVQPGERVLLARAEVAREVLPVGLSALGAEVDDVAAYRTVPTGEDAAETRQLLQEGRISLLTFTSSSTVLNFLNAVPLEEARGVKVACIGPITAETAVKHGLQPDIVAHEYTIDGLVKAVVEYYQNERGMNS